LRNGTLVAMVSNSIVKLNQLRYEQPEGAAWKNQPSSSFINTISHAGKSSRLYNWGHIFPVLAQEHGILVNEDLQSLIVEVMMGLGPFAAHVQDKTRPRPRPRQDETRHDKHIRMKMIHLWSTGKGVWACFYPRSNPPSLFPFPRLRLSANTCYHRGTKFYWSPC
jgi:hypothetical protein